METAIDPPYTELVTYLGIHPELEPAVWRTLSYVDNAVLAQRITARTLDRRRAARHDHAAVDRLRGLQCDRGAEGDRRLSVLGPFAPDGTRRAPARRRRRTPHLNARLPGCRYVLRLKGGYSSVTRTSA